MTTRGRQRSLGARPVRDARDSAKRTVDRLRQEQRSLRHLLEAMGSELELSELLTRILRSACELLVAFETPEWTHREPTTGHV